MSRQVPAYAAAKACEGGFEAESKQVGRTRAVTGAKAAERLLDTAQFYELAGPLVFTPQRIMGVPNLEQLQVRTEVVQVPVRPPAVMAVMGNARRHPTGTKGAADIDIVAGRQGQPAERADLDLLGSSAAEYQRITAGQGFHLWRKLKGPSLTGLGVYT